MGAFAFTAEPAPPHPWYLRGEAARKFWLLQQAGAELRPIHFGQLTPGLMDTRSVLGEVADFNVLIVPDDLKVQTRAWRGSHALWAHFDHILTEGGRVLKSRYFEQEISVTEPFYLVWCPTSHRPPTVKHPNHEAASAEAQRLAEANVEHDFHVLQHIGTARAPKAAAAYHTHHGISVTDAKAPDRPKLKLEVGKFYRSVDGEKVGPMERSYNELFQASSHTRVRWKIDGSRRFGDRDLSLVEEWVEADFKVGDRVNVAHGLGRWVGEVVKVQDHNLVVTCPDGWPNPDYGDGRYWGVGFGEATKIEKPWTPDGEGWIEHNGSNVNPAPGANVEWIIADERQAKHYIYVFNRSEDVLWSCVVAYRVVEAAKQPRTLKHGEYQVGDRVRYTGRNPEVSDTRRIGAVGVVTDVKSYAVEVKWDDGESNPNGPLPDNLEHEGLPQFHVGDSVRVKASGLINVPSAAGCQGLIEGIGEARFLLRFDQPIRNMSGHLDYEWWASSNEIELAPPVR